MILENCRSQYGILFGARVEGFTSAPRANKTEATWSKIALSFCRPLERNFTPLCCFALVLLTWVLKALVRRRDDEKKCRSHVLSQPSDENGWLSRTAGDALAAY